MTDEDRLVEFTFHIVHVFGTILLKLFADYYYLPTITYFIRPRFFTDHAMADSDMEISSDSESVIRTKFRDDNVTSEVIPIPLPNNPSSSHTASRSTGDNPVVTAMPLKKRWRQSLEQEPKKKKVSLEAYRKRRASGGDSGDSLFSTSGTDSASTSAQLKENVKNEHKLARELARQKLSIGELERRKAKLKKALKQIDAAAEVSGPNAVAKNEFDKFTEKQSRWLEKRAREKQREVKLEHFNSSMEAQRSEEEQRSQAKKSAVVPDTKKREPKVEKPHERKGLNHRLKQKPEDPRLKKNSRHRSEGRVEHLPSSLDVKRRHERNGPSNRAKRSGQHHSKSSLNTERSSSSSHRHTAVPNTLNSRLKRGGHPKSEVKRSRADFTSTLHCLQKAKEEVQRQLDMLRSPACRDLSAAKNTNGFSRMSPQTTNTSSPKHSSGK